MSFSTKMTAATCLKLIYHFSRPESARFTRAMKNVEGVQKQLLKTWLANSEKTELGKKYQIDTIHDYDAFQRKLPRCSYEHFSEAVQKQKKGAANVLSPEDCERYQPTSGTVSKMKWIPYPKQFLDELDKAVSPMLVDAFRSAPGTMRGKQYWSLSFIPTDLRKKIPGNANDDMKLLPWWKRLLLQSTMAVPESVSWTKTSESSVIATLAYLVSTENLALISVWSPTFALNLFEKLVQYKDELTSILKAGDWLGFQPLMGNVPPPKCDKSADILSNWNKTIDASFLKRLWPQMALVSAWDTSTARLWAEKLKVLFPDAVFKGKGLWSTEGVVTIPFENRYPLAVTSHFFEFEDAETGTVFPAWALKKGQVVKPLLTTGSGFFRYELNDKLMVTSILYQCPCFEFLGRDREVDLTGEKLAPEIASEVIIETSRAFNISVVTLAAAAGLSEDSSKPGYYLLCDTTDPDSKGYDPALCKQIVRFAEEILMESFHYKLARELGQLRPLSIIPTPDGRKKYLAINEGRGMVLGDMKIEPLILLSGSELQVLRQ